LSKFYDNEPMPAELKRKFDVYDRIKKAGISLGTFEEHVGSLKGRNIAGTVFHKSGLVYLSGQGGGQYQMSDDPDKVKHGQQAASDIADAMIARLHWAITCGKEGGDLNDVLYTVKALGMVVSTDVDFKSGPSVVNGFSGRWQTVFGGAYGANAQDGLDASYSGVHARSAIGGFTGRFSLEPEIIVCIPAALAEAIIMNRGWVMPLPPAMYDKVKKLNGK
jgi:hypothetical protein